MTSFRFLLLSAELPGEGVWCTATTYADCVAKVMEVWGSDFVPIFKYKLCCSPQGAEEELKYYRHTSHYEHHHSRFDIHRRPVQNEEEQKKASSSADGDADHVDGANLDHKGWLHDAKTCEAGMMGRCYIVIDDERDFELWLHGGAALEHTEDVDAQEDTFHHANYHALEEHPHPLTTKLFAFRKTSMAVSCTTPSSAAATAAAHPHPMIHNGDASRGSIHTYYNTITSKDGIFRQRSSPAVKHGEDDVVRVPMHSMIPPLVLMKLGVSVVLRHSNASELILTTSRYSVGTEKTCWGNLMLKARSAWGVHEPIFRYVDLSQGYAQMNVANVLDYRFWSEGVGLDRRELVVLEHAPTKDLQCGAFMEAELRRHYAAHPPPSVAAPDKHALPYLIQKLSELERHHREESVQRPRTLPEIVADTREAERRAAELLLPPIHQQQQQQQQRAQPQPTQKQTSMAASGPSPTTTSSLRNGRVVPRAAPSTSTSSSSSTAVSSTSTSSPAEVHKKDGAPPAFLTDDETPRSRYKRIRQYIARVSAKIDGVSEEEAEEQRRAAELAQKQKEADEADVIVIESNHHEMMVVPTEDGGMLVLEMEVVPEENEAIEEGEEEEEEEDVAMEVVEALNDGNVLVLEMEVVPSDEGYYDDDDDDDVTDEAAQEEAYPSQSGDNDEEYAYNSCVDAQPETNGMTMGDDEEEEVAASPQELLRAAYLQGTAGSRLCGGIAPAEQRYVSSSIREGAYGPSYSPAAMLDNPNRPDPTDADRRRREMELQRQLAAEHQLQLAQRFRRQREMAAGRMPPTATATRA